MNLLNLIENTTSGYDNLRALLQAVSTRSDAHLNLGGEPITLDYMEANFLNGIYRAYLKAGRQEEFIQDLSDPRRFDMHMKKLRDLIAKQRSFKGSVPGQRGVTGDVPAGVMEGLEALEEIAMQDPDNPTEQNAGKLNWTRMIQDYMDNKPYTEFEFGSDRPLTIYRTQIYAILKAFGNMKPAQKVNIILNTFGNKIATVEYLDKLRAKKLIPQKVPAYVAPGTETPNPAQMTLPGMETPKIKEATAQKKSPRELARDTATSAKVQRAFQLARARQPAAASDIEAFVKDEIERGEELAQQVTQLQQDNEQQSQQIAQLTKAVTQQTRTEPTPTPPAPSAPAKAVPTEPKEPPVAKAEPRAEPERQPAPTVEPKAEPAPQTQPAPAKSRKPRAKPRAKPKKIPVDTTIQVPSPRIPDQRPSAQILQFPGSKDEVGAALQGLDLGDVPRAVGQNESVRVTVRGNPLFEGKDGTVKQRIADDFFMVDVDGFGSHAFHVSKLVFEMQTKLDRFNIDQPMLPSGVAKVKYARDNNMYDDARIQEALPDKAMAVLKNLQQQQQQPQIEPTIDLNVPAGPRRGRPTNAERAQRHEEFLTLRRRIALLDELIRMKEQIDTLFLKAQNVRGGIYPGLQADIEMEELYPVPETDQQFQDLKDKYAKDLAALQKFLAMKKAVYREGQERVNESASLVRLQQARQRLAQQLGQGVAEGSTSHAELAKMAHDAYVAASRKGNGPMAAHYLKQYQKHKADAAKDNKGVAEGSLDDIEDTRQFRNAIALAKSQKAIRQARYGKDQKFYADGTPVTPAEVARRAAERKAKKQGVAEGNNDDWYDDADEFGMPGSEFFPDDDRLRDGDYVRDRQDGESGEIFRMSGDPTERRVRILDRDGRGWYISPERLVAVDRTDPDIMKYFGKRRQRDMDESAVAEGFEYGSRVQHPKYGAGQIIKVYSNGTITVNFPNYPDPIDKKPGVQSNFAPGDNGYQSLKPMVSEKQDACYHKVKSRYKVWPSAYASGALVQCRKKGAANWGNKKK